MEHISSYHSYLPKYHRVSHTIMINLYSIEGEGAQWIYNTTTFCCFCLTLLIQFVTIKQQSTTWEKDKRKLQEVLFGCVIYSNDGIRKRKEC